MRADRLLSLLVALQVEGPLTAQELAHRFEVSERTIYRDIEALSVVGIPIYTQRGTNGGIFLDESYRTTLTGLSLTDLRALFIASNSGPLRDLGLAVETSILKLLAAIPRQHQQEVERLRTRFYIDTERWFDFSPQPFLLPQLQQAVWEDRQIVMHYTDYEGRSLKLVVDACALVAKANVWYLVARRSDKEYRTYRVTRISDLILTNAHFDRDQGFDLVAYWDSMTHQFERARQADYPFYASTLRVTSAALSLLREYVPERITVLNAGTHTDTTTDLSTVQVMFLSAHEALMNVLALGVAVEILEPEALRTRVSETAWAVVHRLQVSDSFDEKTQPQ